MRRINLLISFVLFALGVSAQPISEQEALQKAQRFLQGKNIVSPAKARNLSRGAAGNPYKHLYLFNVVARPIRQRHCQHPCRYGSCRDTRRCQQGLCGPDDVVLVGSIVPVQLLLSARLPRGLRTARDGSDDGFPQIS